MEEGAAAIHRELDVPSSRIGRLRSIAHADTPPIYPCRLPPHRLDSIDETMIEEWHKWLRRQGWTPPATARAIQHMKSFARRMPDGLHRVTAADLLAYAQDRAFTLMKLRKLDAPSSLPATRTWAEFVTAARSFYRFATQHGTWVSAHADPTRDIPEPVRTQRPRRVVVRLYEELLHHPSLSHREAAILWLLAHGIGCTEVIRLRPEDVDLKLAYVHVDGPQRARLVPLSPRGVEKLTPWVHARYTLGSRWLFPATPQRHIGDRALRHVVQTAAERAFHDQPLARQAIHAAGFRTILIRRGLRRLTSIGALQGITGLGRHALIDLCLAEPMPFEQLRRELARLTAKHGRSL